MQARDDSKSGTEIQGPKALEARWEPFTTRSQRVALTSHGEGHGDSRGPGPSGAVEVAVEQTFCHLSYA